MYVYDILIPQPVIGASRQVGLAPLMPVLHLRPTSRISAVMNVASRRRLNVD